LIIFHFLFQKKETKRKTNLFQEPQDKHPRDIASPGFRLRQQNPLVKIEKGSRESLVTDGVSEIEMAHDDVTEKRMKQILGRMYNDKKYLEQLVEQAGTVTFI
jgi:2-succinyl-5-enolpyruvyl-6-hydroxy-3-cyclohexene-1-carboxylate synthase